MALLFQNKRTSLKSGDRLTIDLDNECVILSRAGENLTKENDGLDFYLFLPQDGVQITDLLEFIADTNGLGFKSLSDDELLFEFINSEPKKTVPK